MTLKEKSVRELGGEIWAELDTERRTDNSVFSSLDHVTTDYLIDFIMSILARHVNATIINDVGLEVEPRPKINVTGDSSSVSDQ